MSMFSRSVFLLLAMAVSTASATKFDCWFDWDCQTPLGTRLDMCTLSDSMACNQQTSRQECYDIGAKSTCIWGECPGGCEKKPKWDCWAEHDCTVPLRPSNGCTIPDTGDNANACVNMRSKEKCFEIGAESACIWGECPDGCMKPPPKVWGDPHFKTWTGTVWDFHGVCDLNFFESPSHNLTIHLRTDQKFGRYSYVSAAAIELNGDIFEFGGHGSMVVNGMTMIDVEKDNAPPSIGGYRLFMEDNNKKTHSYKIYLGDHQTLEFKSYKEMVGVSLNAAADHFPDGRGLMGSPKTGDKLGRDGVTVFQDDNRFGMEWQVLENEPKLFENADRFPQAPQTCHIPEDGIQQSHRRLGESKISREEAENACAKHGSDKEACVFDVMATGDLDMAESF